MTPGPGTDLARLLRGRAEDVAPRLLGCLLVSATEAGRVVVRVTEVEAYAGVGEDPGSHAHKGRRPRNATMFGPPGSLYVYFTYGMHWCANVVAHPVADGAAGAVLLRAGEVLEGHELARDRRPTATRDADLARGPARLTKALGIAGGHDGSDLLDPASRVRLLPAGTAPDRVTSGPRVGVSGDGATTPWRWWDARSTTVSAYRAAQPRRTAPRHAPAAMVGPGADSTGGAP